MMRYYFVLLFFIISSFNQLLSQDENTSLTRILFQGVVMDARSLSPLASSQIWVNKSYTSATDNDGRFGFWVNAGDTLYFRRLGYRTASIVVSDTLIGKQYIAGIYLNTDTVSIGEVVIMPRAANLRSEILNAPVNVPPEYENARYNVAVTAHAARTTPGNLGSPDANYSLIRQKQRTDAYEKGGIPSDRMVAISPLMLLPAAYLLIHGLPPRAPAYKPDISDYELDQLNKMFRDRYRNTGILPEK